LVIQLTRRTTLKNRILFLIGSSDREVGDYPRLLEAAGTKRQFSWSTPKDAKPGDIVLIYIASPVSAVIAKGVVLAPARKTSKRDRYDYRAEVGRIHLTSNPADIRELKRAFPKWRWLTYPRMHAVVPPEYSENLWKLVHQPKEKAPTLQQIAAKIGAGFGSPEQNRKVEAAAIKKATRELRSRGYSVVSRERDKIGYDLEARKGRSELHVEVKGVTGSAVKFPITSNEVKRAARDKAFRLMAVTQTLTRSAEVHEFTGKQVASRFQLSAIAYYAELR
jgi:Domain of unknown function (DUF3883)